MPHSTDGNKKCAHLACHCNVAGDDAYCSEHCRKRVESPLSDQQPGCHCGHPACETEEHDRAARR